jgi:hypothetical protein
MPLKTGAVEERLLYHPPLAVGRISCATGARIKREFFNTSDVKQLSGIQRDKRCGGCRGSSALITKNKRFADDVKSPWA